MSRTEFDGFGKLRDGLRKAFAPGRAAPVGPDGREYRDAGVQLFGVGERRPRANDAGLLRFAPPARRRGQDGAQRDFRRRKRRAFLREAKDLPARRPERPSGKPRAPVRVVGRSRKFRARLDGAGRGALFPDLRGSRMSAEIPGVRENEVRAVVLHEHGDIDNLVYHADYRDPARGPGQVVLRVRATSLNYHDVFTTKGMPGIKVPLPIVIGLDIAGEILEIGEGVEGWAPGDRALVNPLDPVAPEKGLMGEMLDGGTAELCAVDATRLIRIPDGCSYEQAAALPVAYGTAHRMMVANGGMKGGEKVLVLGASGGVGSCCVLLAKMMGCEVVAAGSSPEKLSALKAWGADHVIGYDGFEKTIYGLYGKPHRRRFEGGVDVTINFTGGDTWVPSLKATRRGGKILTCGATAGYDPAEDLRYVWTFELKILGSNSWTVEDLETLMKLISRGELSPVIDTVLPLERTAEGVRRLRDREVIGKIVITP